MTTNHFDTAWPALESLWRDLQLPKDQLQRITLTGQHPVLPSSFAVSTAAQSSIAAAAAMASVIGQHRSGEAVPVSVDSIASMMECTALFTIDGETPAQWAALSGLYQTNDGYIRLHANFDHHRDAALRVLGLPEGPHTLRTRAEERVAQRESHALEQAVVDAGGACSTLRSFSEWDDLPQAKVLAGLPLIEITKIADAEPRKLPAINTTDAPLKGLRVLDLTRILAGPVCGRTLAAYGADVMLVNSPKLPNIESIIDTSRGKLSALADLSSEEGRQDLHRLISGTHAFVQGYRPGSLDALGFGVDEVATRYPGIVYTSLSAYGRSGPWSERRGFDSLVQTATGFNTAEAKSFDSPSPKAMPVQILDYATGFLMAFGTQVALHRQSIEGGTWHVQLSLARTGTWLRSLGQSTEHLSCSPINSNDHLRPYPSAYGELAAMPHAVLWNGRSVEPSRPSAPPGTHEPHWPQ